RQRHLQDVGQEELDPVSEQLLHPGPAGRALLDPDDASGASCLTACLVDYQIEWLVRGEHLREHLLASGAMVEPADDTGAIMVIDAQDDIVGHGRSPVKAFSARWAGTPE